MLRSQHAAASASARDERLTTTEYDRNAVPTDVLAKSSALMLLDVDADNQHNDYWFTDDLLPHYDPDSWWHNLASLDDSPTASQHDDVVATLPDGTQYTNVSDNQSLETALLRELAILCCSNDDAVSSSISNSDRDTAPTVDCSTSWYKPVGMDVLHAMSSVRLEAAHSVSSISSDNNNNQNSTPSEDCVGRTSSVSSLQSTASKHSTQLEASLQRPSSAARFINTSSHLESDPSHRSGFGSGVAIATLWLGSQSASTSSIESKRDIRSSVSSGCSSLFSEDSVSLDLMSSDAVVSSLGASSSAVSSLSSLSSLSYQSGVYKLASPRQIENIPVVSAAMANSVEPASPDSPRLLTCPTYHSEAFGHAASATFRPIDELDTITGSSDCTGRARRFRRQRATDHHERQLQLHVKLQQRFVTPAARVLKCLRHTASACPTVTDSNKDDDDSRDDLDLFVPFSALCGIFDAHAPRRHGLVLDLGCGTSTICRELVLHGYSHVFGVDVEAHKLAHQRTKCSADLERFVHFYAMDATALAFPDSVFDCILTKALLDMVATTYVYVTDDSSCDDLERVLSEIARCLAPGGVWILVSCYGDRTTSCSLVLDDELKAVDMPSTRARHETPWWQWRGAAEVIRTYFDLVQTYGAGVPELQNGVRVKPFTVIVYRRKDRSRWERLARLLRDQHEARASAREYEVDIVWRAERRRLRAELDLRVSETQHMVVEDVAGQFIERASRIATVRTKRDALQGAIEQAMLAADRSLMTIEDAAAAAVRAEHRNVLAFIERLLSGVITDALTPVAFEEVARTESCRVTSETAEAPVFEIAEAALVSFGVHTTRTTSAGVSVVAAATAHAITRETLLQPDVTTVEQLVSLPTSAPSASTACVAVMVIEAVATSVVSLPDISSSSTVDAADEVVECLRELLVAVEAAWLHRDSVDESHRLRPDASPSVPVKNDAVVCGDSKATIVAEQQQQIAQANSDEASHDQIDPLPNDQARRGSIELGAAATAELESTVSAMSGEEDAAAPTSEDGECTPAVGNDECTLIAAIGYNDCSKGDASTGCASAVTEMLPLDAPYIEQIDGSEQLCDSDSDASDLRICAEVLGVIVEQLAAGT